MDRLSNLPTADEAHIQLQRFLAKEFAPCLRDIIRENNDRQKKWSISPNAELALEERILSPSDFGFHNILRRSDGRLVFLDFEHFGWDDPAKLISDFLLHPHELMALQEPLKRYFVKKIILNFSGSVDSLVKRLEMVYPLYALKWCMILLNEFVPVDWSRRVFSNSPVVDKSAVQIKQLEKARQMLAKSRNASASFPHWS
jgi:thiamine kinase-like enzyme